MLPVKIARKTKKILQMCKINTVVNIINTCNLIVVRQCYQNDLERKFFIHQKKKKDDNDRLKECP
jgi:hypothetical protein